MYTIPELRLNCFQDVRIPSAKDLYSKLGLRNVSRPGSVGKDGEFTEPVNVQESKLDSLRSGEYAAYAAYANHRDAERQKAEAADNQSVTTETPVSE